MEKRGTTTELNREGFEADIDGYCSRAPSSNSTRPLTFLTKEEILSSGRKLLRLKRTLTPSHLEPSQSHTEEAFKDLKGHMSHISNRNENAKTFNMSLDSKSDFSDKANNSDITLTKDPKDFESNKRPPSSLVASSEIVCEKVKLIKTLEEKAPPHTDSETSCSSNLQDEKSIESQNGIESTENKNREASLQSIDAGNSIKKESELKVSEMESDTKDLRDSNEAKINLTTPDNPTRETSTENNSNFFTKYQVTTPIDREIKPSSGSSSECQPIFGNFFNKQFTNPFAETAKQGEKKFSVSQSFLSSIQTKETILTSLSKEPTTELVDNNDPSCQSSNDTISSIQFPGEEDDVELYSDKNVILLKCVPVKVEATESLKESESKTEPKLVHKFKRQGEGVLRLLQKKKKGDAQSDDTKQTRRLVFRQRGTFTLLLNSPLWVSKTFDKIPQMTGGFGVRFVGINALVTKESNQVAFESYIFKFKLEKQRADFLDAVTKYQIA